MLYRPYRPYRPYRRVVDQALLGGGNVRLLMLARRALALFAPLAQQLRHPGATQTAQVAQAGGHRLPLCLQFRPLVMLTERLLDAMGPTARVAPRDAGAYTFAPGWTSAPSYAAPPTTEKNPCDSLR